MEWNHSVENEVNTGQLQRMAAVRYGIVSMQLDDIAEGSVSNMADPEWVDSWYYWPHRVDVPTFGAIGVEFCRNDANVDANGVHERCCDRVDQLD